MSTYPPEREGKTRGGYLPIGVAIMLACCLVAIFVIDAQANGYGTNDPVQVLEAGGVIWAGTLVGYLVFIWRSATHGYSYNSW